MLLLYHVREESYMWKQYQMIDASEALDVYETMWKESARQEAAFNRYSPAQKSNMKLRSIWPKYAQVKLIVHGYCSVPTKVFDAMSNSRMAETEKVLQFMDWNVLNVSTLSREDNLSITDIKIEVIRPGYRIGDPIPA